MDTTNRRKPKSLEEFLDALEQEETADDVPASEIEAGEAAYKAYREGRERGLSLEQFKAELAL